MVHQATFTTALQDPTGKQSGALPGFHDGNKHHQR